MTASGLHDQGGGCGKKCSFAFLVAPVTLPARAKGVMVEPKWGFQISFPDFVYVGLQTKVCLCALNSKNTYLFPPISPTSASPLAVTSFYADFLFYFYDRKAIVCKVFNPREASSPAFMPLQLVLNPTSAEAVFRPATA